MTDPNTNIKEAVGAQGSPLQSGNQVISDINRDFKERSVQEKARTLGLDYINLSKIPINPEILYIVTEEEARQSMFFPFFRIGKKLRVAISDPSNQETIKTIESLKNKGYQINLNLTSEDCILESLELYKSDQYRLKNEIVNELDLEKIAAYEQEIKNLYALKDKLSSVTSEEGLNLINLGAFKTGASDIHFQPEENLVIVRFRIDGVLQEIFRLDPKVFSNIANQLKYKAKMKLNIDNIPQDGRYSFMINKEKIDVRVNSLPTEFGEAFVCRLLKANPSLYDFKTLGFSGNNLEKIKNASQIVNGMILVTGPTGSGKTTTLYSLISILNTPDKKIITLEDPIEYNLENVTQSQINQKRDYTFATGLRAILRQDPDVVMIGEIRDLETAETSAQASLTGHVVLSTLHTNSAIETIPRLVNMGLKEFMIAPSIHTVVAQRLVRKICVNCQTESEITQAESDEISLAISEISKLMLDLPIDIPSRLKRPNGCEVCSHTGYKGQIGVIEVIHFDPELKDLILGKVPAHHLFEEARKKKMLTMSEDGILKVISGITTLEEVHRVTRNM